MNDAKDTLRLPPGRKHAIIDRQAGGGRLRGRVVGRAMILRIKVKPNSRASQLSAEPDGSWRAQLRAPPVDGKANAELVTLLAEHFQCPKSAVTIKSGLSGRSKIVRIDVP